MKLIERCTVNFIRNVTYFTVKVACDCSSCSVQKADKALRRRTAACESFNGYDAAYQILESKGWKVNRALNTAYAPKHLTV